MKSNGSKFSKLLAGLVVSSLALSGAGVTFAAEDNKWAKLVERGEYDKTKTSALSKTIGLATEHAVLETFVKEIAQHPNKLAGDILKDVCTRYKNSEVFGKRQIVDSLTAAYGGQSNLFNYPKIVQAIDLIEHTTMWDNWMHINIDSIYNDYLENLKK